ncbi:tetratricopeptide repeat protein [Pontibacter sp. KCTC 32443]|uniref:tetratricopeptide repeat protein n=1 Tax=Pontibacter TaxID=323449 RepID=UPI00164EB15C|nr:MULTISPECIES: tetratricopeptide repeat protein [Pontibacter]MBC5774411.1 tetratricopeptide repeat protein [Pontibacter sp. KCTC 32443]
MKHLILLTIGVFLTMNLQAQKLSEKVMQKACDCVNNLKTYQQLQDSLQNCTVEAMAFVMKNGTSEERETLSKVEGITGIFKDVKEALPSYCDNVRKLMVEEKVREYYRLSLNKNANKYYEEGNELLEKGDFTGARKEYEKAVKIDKNFVYALDHIAISYRREKNFELAIKYYKKSLDVFPEGNLAHLNLAVVYSLLEDYDNALKHYQELVYLYQDDPEGYFGAGKILFIQTKYEQALENLFTAYLLYKKTNSNYLKDSESLISMVYTDLKNKGKLDIFTQKAQQYNVSISE